jgi:cysteine desulfuration protein SufE
MSPMSTQNQMTLEELKDNFEFLGDWEQRFTYLLDLGKKLPEMDEADMNEQTLVHGCQSTVYLKEQIEPGDPPTIEFVATSDAYIVRGLIAILQVIYNGKTPQQVIETDAVGTLGELGLEEHLSPTRRNGLHAMIGRIRALAEQNQH